MGSTETSAENHRPHLLLSYGTCILTIAHKVYRRVEEMNDLIGLLAKRVSSMTSPIFHPLQLHWLLILSFLDKQIFAIEDITMSIFPPSTYIFRKVDELALLADSLPKVFDDTMDGLLILLHQVPLFDWAAGVLGAMLKKCINLMPDWNPSSVRSITVDVKCEGEERQAVEKLKLAEKMHYRDRDDGKQKKKTGKELREIERRCKEIIMESLECMEVVENLKQRSGGDRERRRKGGEQREVSCLLDERKSGKREEVKDPILELFDEGWHLKPF
ncbi:uncharacterized protein [Typha latifolia]|uniref:uncharacterized protein n=1 Tax=Typha latifolia TaxID=4733 RepID=UPI003C2F38D2